MSPHDQAFPIPGDDEYIRWLGLTKRELFAAMAMQGVLANPVEHLASAPREDIAGWAVEFADALLDELAKEPQP